MKLTALAMDVRVGNPLRKLVLLKLCDNANDRGECWPSIQHIADQCEISRRSVINHVQALVDAGFLRVINRAREGEKISNLYVVSLGGKPVTGGSAGDALGSAGDALGSAGDALGSAGDALGSAGDALGGSAGDAHRTSHSLEPVNEPVIESKKIPKKPAEASRGSRLPGNWSLPTDWAGDVAMIDSRLVPRVQSIADNFRDYWVSRAGAGGRKVDWRATWRNWLRREAERLPASRLPSRSAAVSVDAGFSGGAGKYSGAPVSTRDRPLVDDLRDKSWARG